MCVHPHSSFDNHMLSTGLGVASIHVLTIVDFIKFKEAKYCTLVTLVTQGNSV